MTRDDETTTVEEEPEDGAEPSAPAEEAALEEQALAPAEDEADPVALERDRYLALAQRTQADFENFRKRSSRDVAAADSRGVTRLAKELLPALDNLGRALAATASGAASEHDLALGVQLVHSELVSALGRVGIEAFSPEGEQFDPQHHEAVSQQPVEGAEPGTVAEVYQPGYRFGETVLRPARVVVAA